MKLLLSDTPLTVSLKTENEMYIDLSALNFQLCRLFRMLDQNAGKMCDKR